VTRESFVIVRALSLPRSRAGVHYVLALVWLAYTVAMAAWWLSVGLTLTGRRTMFLLEGATFFIVLVAGGLALIIAIRREHQRRQSLETFFMSFTHDLKTSLAAVQLQAEGLREDWPETTARPDLDRLLGDTVRLQIQLENSLFVAQPDGRLLAERIDVGSALSRLVADWPSLAVRVEGSAAVGADARAFDVIIRNVLQNAVIHGQAREVVVAVSRPSPGMVRLTIADDGRGMPAAAAREIGRPFVRAGHTSGSGVGLYVSRKLLVRMGGGLSVLVAGGAGRGLTLAVDLPEAT
jgi:signal transduction histidine kinase